MSEPVRQGATTRSSRGAAAPAESAVAAPATGERALAEGDIVPGNQPGEREPASLSVSSQSGEQKTAEKLPGIPGTPGVDGFMEVVGRYEGPLLRYVGKLIGADAAQDVVQETFLRLHVQWKDHGRSSVRSEIAWLSQVAHRLAVDLLRKRERDGVLKQTLAQTPATTNEAPSGAGGIALRELEHLPEEEKQVVLLRVIQGLKLREIAAVTGLSLGSVDHKITRALRTLAQRLQRDDLI